MPFSFTTINIKVSLVKNVIIKPTILIPVHIIKDPLHLFKPAKTSYSLPKVKTNYGQFNIRYNGPKIWNESIKSLSFSNLKTKDYYSNV